MGVNSVCLVRDRDDFEETASWLEGLGATLVRCVALCARVLCAYFAIHVLYVPMVSQQTIPVTLHHKVVMLMQHYTYEHAHAVIFWQ